MINVNLDEPAITILWVLGGLVVFICLLNIINHALKMYINHLRKKKEEKETEDA